MQDKGWDPIYSLDLVMLIGQICVCTQDLCLIPLCDILKTSVCLSLLHTYKGNSDLQLLSKELDSGD